MKKVLVCVPCLDHVATPFAYSLTMMAMSTKLPIKITFLQNSLIYDARNAMAAQFLDDGADYALWIDSDMTFPPDIVQKFVDDMEQRDFVCGIYFRRKIPLTPIISRETTVDGKTKLEVFSDYPRDQIFEVAGAGFGGCMMSRKILKDVWDKYGNPFYPINGHGEDYSFCERAKSLGFKLYCDSRIKMGHVGTFVYHENHYDTQSQK